MSKQHALGIDLGTSNCAMALARPESLEVVEITQITGEGRVGEASTFASALYLPHEGQFPPDSLRLPWNEHADNLIAGNFAREIGAQVPDRLITSAKSWLSQRGADPRKPVLPWGSQAVKQKLSAVDATRAYLDHLRQSFLAESEALGVNDGLETTQVVLTVPASFDEAARSMTARAAVEAGWGEDVVLLEEPQAAFYAWVAGAGGDWRKEVKRGELILICDVGGGTTDLSLIAVGERQGNLELERVSVGRHVLLGGDNMDLALAFTLRGQIENEGKAIEEGQILELVHACRIAKETLFERPELDEVPVSVASRGSNLFGGTVATSLKRSLLESVVLDGFFPLTSPTELPEALPRTGLREYGLAYEADPIISKHLAQFLTKSRANIMADPSLASLVESTGDGRLDTPYLQPDIVLFNGGVFRAQPLRSRVLELLRSWAPDRSVRELTGTSLDLSVARGAATYGQFKISGKGIRIRAGVSRAYYVGLEPSMPAIPGYRPPVKAVCVAELGMEEGEERVLEDKEFGLLTGTTATFRFFSSPDRPSDAVGVIVGDAERELEETTSLEMEVPDVEGAGEQTTIPVKLHTQLTELGTLRLWMQHIVSQQRWELTFSVRTE
ncbi:MAG: Hsp70 family protein [Chitinivibrionales bacterium]|nr:Hsp70 family protein [Chitinivibrionales bacterium]MBD3358765.1 Hsp70 family protein [Chitinivibrionales bacterium]